MNINIQKRYLIIILGMILFLGILAFNPKISKAASPVEKWGRLHVKGTNIVNKNGKKVQLKGVSTHGIAWFPQYVNKSCFSRKWEQIQYDWLFIAIQAQDIQQAYIQK